MGYSITTPVIMITAYQDTSHFKKGFDLEELHQRIKNLAKRFAIESEENTLQLSADIKLIKDKNIIIVGDKTYEIANKENKILTYLFTHKGRTISFDELIQNIWHFDDMPSETTIRVYIKNLRKILGKDTIKTIRGLGYSYE